VQTDDDAFLADNLMASAAPEAAIEVSALNSDALAPIVDEAINRWVEALNLDAVGVALLEGVDFAIVDLDGLVIGQAIGDTVLIDVDAAGYGWFVDSTPYDDSEFKSQNNAGELTATVLSPAFGDMDLLTVVMHELGHILSFKDMDPEADTLMSGTLDTGDRHLPGDANNQIENSSQTLVLMDSPSGQFGSEVSISAGTESSRHSWLNSWLLNGTGNNDDFDPNGDINIVIKNKDRKNIRNSFLRRSYGN
jgi:hypothetical protein